MSDPTSVPLDTLDRLAFDFAPVGIVLTEERVIRTCNRTFAELFGYRREELLDRSFRMLYASHSEFEAIRDVGLDALRQSGRYTDERVMPRRDGSYFWCRVHVHTFHPDNPMKRVILTFADLSQVRPAISLTARERQVVQHLARGLTSKEIGRQLAISPRTVEDYRARLLAKFDVRNVAGLLARLGGIST